MISVPRFGYAAQMITVPRLVYAAPPVPGNMVLHGSIKRATARVRICIRPGSAAVIRRRGFSRTVSH